MGAAVAQGDAVAERGDLVAAGARYALDQPAHAQPAQVVGGAVRPVVAVGEQRPDVLAELAVGEALREQAERQPGPGILAQPSS